MRPNEPAVLTRLGGGLRKPGPLQGTTRIALAVMLVLSHPLWAATIIVDETTCTLVDAIDSANTDSPVGGCSTGNGPDTIELTNNVTLTTINNYAIDGNNGLPELTSDVTVEGGGFTIERDLAAPAFRFFSVASSGTLTLNDLTLENGLATTAAYSYGGAIVHQGTVHLLDSMVLNNSADLAGGISTMPGGTLTLTHSTVSGNSAETAGGILMMGTGTLTHSTVSGNSATSGAGGLFVYDGSVTLDNTSVTNNLAAYAGGGMLGIGTLTITNSTVSGNTTGGYGGGGIFWGGGTLTMTNSTVSGNTATGYAGSRGGGIASGNPGVITLTNSTVSGNSADYGGGGIYNFDSTVTLTNCTVSGNSASIGGGIGNYVGGTVSLTNTVVANSVSGGNCGGLVAVTDGGNNFSDDATCGPGFNAISGLDLSLADNGGPTLTHALFPESVAIDAAESCGLMTDQRGWLRGDGACDSGSFEFVCGITVGRDGEDTLISFVPDSSEFDLVAGYLSQLLSDHDFSRATCLGTFSTPALDTLPEPPAGDGRYYLARGLTSCVGANYGDSSVTPDPRDDLASNPCP